jgi:hypothetical protein
VDGCAKVSFDHITFGSNSASNAEPGISYTSRGHTDLAVSDISFIPSSGTWTYPATAIVPPSGPSTSTNSHGTFGYFATAPSSITSAWSGITSGANTQTGAFSSAGPWTFSAAGAASTPGLEITGAPFTGGSGSTTLPQFYLNSGNSPSGFSTSGTMLGINAPTSFAGNLFDFYVSGTEEAFMNASGALSIGASPSTTGVFNLPNSAHICERNASGTGDICWVYVDGSNTLNLGVSGTPAASQSTWTISGNGGLSKSNLAITGAPPNGGSSTTTFPLFYLNYNAATAVTTFATGGTEIGINAYSGIGNMMDFHVNGGASVFSVNATGVVNTTGGYEVSGTAGVTKTCGATIVVTGGIITSC